MQSSQIWDTKRALHEAPKSSSGRTRLRCDSVSAGAATQHIAPPTRACLVALTTSAEFADSRFLSLAVVPLGEDGGLQ
jgi:hypothetical protein